MHDLPAQKLIISAASYYTAFTLRAPLVTRLKQETKYNRER